jgi:hypothetical protein
VGSEGRYYPDQIRRIAAPGPGNDDGFICAVVHLSAQSFRRRHCCY